MQREKKSPKESFGMCLSRFATSCSFSDEQSKTRKTWNIFASASTTVELTVRSMLHVPPTRAMFDYERLQFSKRKKMKKKF